MKGLWMVTAAAGLLLLASGCVTTTALGKLPAPAEFNKSVADLQKEYPDLVKYSGAGRECTLLPYMPDAEPLLEAWGKPHHKRPSTLMFIDPVGSLLFYPSTCWYWNFEDKTVVARINHAMGFGYTPHVWKLKVKQRTK